MHNITKMHINTSKNTSLLNKIVYLCIALYFIFIYVISGTIFQYRTYVLAVLSILICLISLFSLKKHIKINEITIGLSTLYLMFILSSMINNDGYILQNIQQLLQYLLLYIGVISFIDSQEKLEKIVKIIFWTGFIGGPTIGIFQMLSGQYLYPLPLDSPYVENQLIRTVISTATQYNANLVAIQLVITFFIGLYLSKKALKKKKMLTVAIAITGIAIILTFSRTTIIASFLALLIYEMKMIKYQKNKIKLVKFVTYFIIVAVMVIFMEDIYMRLVDNSNIAFMFRIKNSENVSIRFLQWSGIKDLMLNSNIINLLFGYGENYVLEIGNLTGYYISSHNTFLEVLAKNGFIAFILFISIFYKAFKNIYHITKANLVYLPILAMFVTVFISLQMLSSFGIESIIILILASINRNIVTGEDHVC